MSGGHFYSGDDIHAIVADIGAYSCKLGFAGEDNPKSLFRSNLAVKRNKDGKVEDMKVDYFSHPLLHPKSKDSDGDYKLECPVDHTTGLWYGISQYELLEKCIEYGFSSALKVDMTGSPFMLIEKSYNPPPLRQQCCELLFESLEVPAAFMARDATLACYACGRTTATVVDIGYNATTVTPVFEGYVEQKGIRKLPLGTRRMDEAVMHTLDQLHPKKAYLPIYQSKYNHPRRSNKDIHLLTRLDIAESCRREGSGAAVLAVSDPGFTAPSKAFELPDGTVLDVPAKARFATADLILGQVQQESIRAREDALANQKKNLSQVIAETEQKIEKNQKAKEYFDALFSDTTAVGLLKRRNNNEAAKKEQQEEEQQAKVLAKNFNFTWPYLRKACGTFFQQFQNNNLTPAPVPAMICDAASRCDRDQQASLLGNVVLAGGGACLGPTEQALSDFVRERVEGILHQHTPGWRVKVLSPNFPERAICSWLGGSILGSMGTFHDMWITKKEYEEWGTAIVNRKCP